MTDVKTKVEITDEDRAELGRLIANGFTSGQLYCDNGKCIGWSLNTNVWSNDK